jgi:2-polyprenyl-3-methyl-5-hydroxy-6-metoxy-1,4-benzoquinol methylase
MDYDSKPEDYYKNNRIEMLQFLDKSAMYVLDVGCSDGSFGKSVKEINNAEVWGIEPQKSAADNAKNNIDKIINKSCEDAIIDLPNNYFDAIFFNDVLEHLVDPYSILEIIKSKLRSNGQVISSIPNVRYHNTFVKVLFGKDWKYEDHGVMDRTHLRFFTGKSVKRMFEEAGYTVEKHQGINMSKSLKPLLLNIPFLFTALDIRYPQYATVARIK